MDRSVVKWETDSDNGDASYFIEFPEEVEKCTWSSTLDSNVKQSTFALTLSKSDKIQKLTTKDITGKAQQMDKPPTAHQIKTSLHPLNVFGPCLPWQLASSELSPWSFNTSVIYDNPDKCQETSLKHLTKQGMPVQHPIDMRKSCLLKCEKSNQSFLNKSGSGHLNPVSEKPIDLSVSSIKSQKSQAKRVCKKRNLKPHPSGQNVSRKKDPGFASFNTGLATQTRRVTSFSDFLYKCENFKKCLQKFSPPDVNGVSIQKQVKAPLPASLNRPHSYADHHGPSNTPLKYSNYGYVNPPQQGRGFGTMTNRLIDSTPIDEILNLNSLACHALHQ